MTDSPGTSQNDPGPAQLQPENKMLGNVQALRAVAVLLVIVVHVSNPYGFEQRYLEAGPALTGWMDVPGQCAVDFFFVISGLILTLTTWRKPSGTRTAKAFVERRLTRIFPTYWIATLPVLAVFLIRPDVVNTHSSHPPEVLQSILVLPQEGLPLVSVGWTLTYEMYFYLVFAAALIAPRRWLLPIMGAWSAMTLVLATGLQDSALPTIAVLADPILLEFLFGIAAAYLLIHRPPIAPFATFTIGIVVLVAALTVAAVFGADAIDQWFRVALVGPPIALITYGAVGLEMRHRLRAPRILRYIGDASFSVYLWHSLFLSAVGHAIVAVLPSTPVVHYVMLVLVPIAAVGVSVVMYELIEKPLLKLFHRGRAKDRARRTPVKAPAA